MTVESQCVRATGRHGLIFPAGQRQEIGHHGLGNAHAQLATGVEAARPQATVGTQHQREVTGLGHAGHLAKQAGGYLAQRFGVDARRDRRLRRGTDGGERRRQRQPHPIAQRNCAEQRGHGQTAVYPCGQHTLSFCRQQRHCPAPCSNPDVLEAALWVAA